MTAKPAEFYDERLAVPGTPLLASVDESRYRPLWKAAMDLIPTTARVVEFGCGAGRFARLLLGRGVQSYVGLDFAPDHIAEARRHVDADFRVADLRTDPLPEGDCYVMLEVLEHLDNDRRVLGRVPSGAAVVLSVPSFESESHVRTFPNLGDAHLRYRLSLDIDHVEYVPLESGAFFHLIRGTRR